MESQKEFHCSCGRVFSSWSAKTMHMRDNRAHKDRDDLESGILAFSTLNLQETSQDEKWEALAKKASRIARKAERAQKIKAKALAKFEEQDTSNQNSDEAGPSAPTPSTPTTQDMTEKQKIKAEKQAVQLERKKAATERRQKKNILRAHKRSLQKMPSSAPAASSSQSASTAPPRRSPRFIEAESSSSAARRGRARRSTMPEMGAGVQDVPEAMDVDMGEASAGIEEKRPGKGWEFMSVAQEKRPVFENPDVEGEGRAYDPVL
ncbi:hypothetical protein BDV97DRAFT_373296 [Delphinella strobiligena]|nr:hypothetical protein BDV97DRAFT_373296 [Delphinella strobiligena]